MALLSSVLASVALGIARAAIEALVELAATKRPVSTGILLRDQTIVQVQIAQAEAMLRAGRAFLLEAVSEAWAKVVMGDTISLHQHALMRLGATHATVCATRVVDLMYQAGGGNSVYASSRLERAMRDIHVVMQHMAISAAVYEPVGRVLLGLDPATTSF
jgi:alkylation response protein AidB-like acyl-CoA dehydrogenase